MYSHLSGTAPETNKVFLWSTPRSMSTALLKCLTYVPDTVAWHEPWLQIKKFGKDMNDPVDEEQRQFVVKLGGQAAVDKIEGGFDARNATHEWLKEQLEGDFPGKKLVFVKELAPLIINRTDTIPSGFRHTFLIRHPVKFAQSIAKIRAKKMAQSSGPQVNMSKVLDFCPYKKAYDLFQYVKENHDANPVIMDADDLLANPDQMLEAYCKAVDIPYSPKLLTWEAGDDVLTKMWMVPKKTILTFGVRGAHEGTFSTTGFVKKERLAPPEISEVPQLMRSMIEAEIPYYEKLYAERFVVQ